MAITSTPRSLRDSNCFLDIVLATWLVSPDFTAASGAIVLDVSLARSPDPLPAITLQAYTASFPIFRTPSTSQLYLFSLGSG